MHPHTYKIRLLFIHKDLNFTKVAETLSSISGIKLGRLANAGEDRYDPFGNKLEGQYFDSRFGFDFETSEKWNKSIEKNSSDAVDEILEKLRPHKALLSELAAKDCMMSVIVSVGVDRNTSVEVTPSLSAKLSEFGLSLYYDMYPPDSPVKKLKQLQLRP